MSTKYHSGRLTIFGLFLIVTTIQGVQFDIKLSCQKFSRNGVCCPGRDNDCVVYAVNYRNSLRHKCYCDEDCVAKNYRNETSCCSDYEQYCKTPVNHYVFTTQSTVQMESPKNNTVDVIIKKTQTNKISIPEDDEDASLENGSGDGSGDGDDDRKPDTFVTKSATTPEVISQNYKPVTTIFHQPKELNELIKSGLRYNPPYLSFMNRKLHEIIPNLPSYYVTPIKYSPRAKNTWAGESWAITASEVLSNRFSIKLDEPIAISSQQIISCSKSKEPEDVWSFIQQNNLVDESCYPLTGDNNKCQINFIEDVLVQCQNSNVYQRPTLYKAGEIYRVVNASDIMNNEANIMTEILKHGSVQATMRVYSDFINYKYGIYKPSPDAQFLGYTSVRINGWREESNGKFWIATNSWGTSWGENGYFKIAKGINSCAIEYYVVGVEV